MATLSIPFKQYRDLEGLNSHYLMDLLRSPVHARFNKEHDEDTDALAFGRAFHTAVLEPGELLMRYAAKPDVDARTKAGKAAIAALPQDKEWLSVGDMARIQGMAAAIRRHKAARELLAGCYAVEQSYTWEMSGLKCKCRVDGIGKGYVVDLKSTHDASKHAFERDIAKYKYHIQGAHYMEGALANQCQVQEFILIAVEKEPPFGVAVYRLDEGYLDAARDQIATAFQLHRQCTKANEWPSYPEQVQDVLCPAWMVSEEYA